MGPEESVPPASDLDVPFFDELPSEAWLAHELELGDPRSVRKMADSVARRRAHFAKYVFGVVAVSAVLCVAALVKSAVAVDASAPASVRTATPVAQPAPPGRD